MRLEEYLGRDDRVVVPLGSTEQHACLSLGTDAILCEKGAIEAARPEGVPVLPVSIAEAGHASWVENFSAARIEGVAIPVEAGPLVSPDALQTASPARVRELRRDGSGWAGAR
ncbi:hypothetical protein GKO32_03255 [Amycolatopsis sp. RM579]|uniref:Creatininase family protein n=2 Tax=Amycolatopsis pithecellobii TaxID=664692 RepID=A0A6N7YJC8_9PSEU|nr:hypothetical protein [Amycolatopsis pithecellobii]